MPDSEADMSALAETEAPAQPDVAGHTGARPADVPARKTGGALDEGSVPERAEVTVYLPRDTYQSALAALQQEGTGRDLPDLLRDLVEQWLPRA